MYRFYETKNSVLEVSFSDLDAVMATGPVESLSPCFDSNGGIMSDSGVLFCSNDIENLYCIHTDKVKPALFKPDKISANQMTAFVGLTNQKALFENLV